MAVATAAYVVAAVAATYGASESHKAGTSQKHARKRAGAARLQAEEKSAVEAKQAEISMKRDKLDRQRNVAANRTLYSDPLGIGGQADVIKKTLTGQ